MANLKWYFPPLNGGEDKGLNDAGIENFSRRMHLARETCQNVIDAHDPEAAGPPSIEFEHLQIPMAEFPDLERFKEIFLACRDYELEGVSKDGKEPNPLAKQSIQFFSKGEELLNGDSIPALRIRDSGTTGLTGNEDDRGGRWYRLVRGQGRSNLEGAGGGTYGIGQRAPFAFSDLRLIFYSTKLADGTNRFMGKTVLCTCKDPETQKKTQNVGFLGKLTGDEGGVSAISDPCEIPEFYLRDSIGTDIYIIGFNVTNWQTRILRSVLSNFYGSIDQEILNVTIANGEIQVVERDTLIELIDEELKRTSNDEKDGLTEAKYGVLALREPVGGKAFERVIDKLGVVKFYVHRADDAKERIAHIRKPGMVVMSKGSKKLSKYQGVIVVDDEKGNSYLSSLEDPGHTRWHQDEARAWTENQRAEAQDVLLQLKRFYWDILKELRGVSKTESEDIEGLAQYLPAEDDGEEYNRETNRPSKRQTTDETPLETPTSCGQVIIQTPGGPPTLQTTTEGGGDEPGEIGSGPEDGLGGLGDANGGSGPIQGEDEGDIGGGDGDETTLTDADLDFRSWQKPGGSVGDYVVAVKSNKKVVGNIVLKAAGEVGTYSLVVLSAKDAETGIDIPVSNNRLCGLKFGHGDRKRIELTVETDVSLSLRLGA